MTTVSREPTAPIPAPTAPAGMPATVAASAGKRVRDPRLDFFRGIAMFIIFIAHVPNDWFALWIPARFGFSDATETFVFCSGMASAIAFGAVFDKHGLLMGAARIAHRVWQVYWAHIALFFAVLTLMLAINASGVTDKNYALALNLGHFLNRTDVTVPGLMTLTYVPNYFDILPMYLVILGMIPIVMALSRVSLWLVAAFMAAMWGWANAGLVGLPGVDLPAEPWSSREWFFNPFGWQLVFFTGFAFMRGWLPAPPVNRWLVIAAAAFVILCVPYAWSPYNSVIPWLQEMARDNRDVANALRPLTTKTDFGILRYVHFLATAYLAWVAVGPLGSRLADWGPFTVVVDIIRKVGQQSLAVFVTSLFLAQFTGFVMDQTGRTWTIMVIANALGFAALIATAYTVGWFKSEPWRRKPVEGGIARSDMPGTVVPAVSSASQATRNQGAVAPSGVPAE